jgi:hypothetical protein
MTQMLSLPEYNPVVQYILLSILDDPVKIKKQLVYYVLLLFHFNAAPHSMNSYY